MSIRPIWAKPSLVTDWQDEEQEEREVYWISLFYDLILVAGVSAISDPFNELVELEECARVPGLALTSRRLSWICLFGLHQAYNVPGWVIAIYCLNYSPSPWTGWNSESCFGAKPIKP